MTYWITATILLSVTWIARGAEMPDVSAPAEPSLPASEEALAVESAPAPAALPDETSAPAVVGVSVRARPSPRKSASDPTPLGTAVVKGNNVNVRGQPTIYSEVVMQLRQGDRVVVLDELSRTNSKPEDPAEWAKIALPSSVSVWVHSGFIDPGTKTVKPTRLNLRGGPGENYSVLGQIERGTVVRELATEGAWWKIEAPDSAYAFVASRLLEEELPVTTVASAPPPTEAAETVVPTPTEPVAATPVETPPVEVVQAEPVEPSTEKVAEATPGEVVGEMFPTIEPGTTSVTETASQEVDFIDVEEEKPIRRVVSREGFVRRSVSVQAPTYFVLDSPHTRKTINYLYSPPSNNIVLRDFEGQRILVTGEELMDERWPKTPVINVEKLRTLP